VQKVYQNLNCEFFKDEGHSLSSDYCSVMCLKCGEMLAWLSVWSEVQMICIWSSWCHCHPIISCSSNIQNGVPFWCRLTQVVLEKRPLNGCSRVVVKDILGVPSEGLCSGVGVDDYVLVLDWMFRWRTQFGGGTLVMNMVTWSMMIWETKSRRATHESYDGRTEGCRFSHLYM